MVNRGYPLLELEGESKDHPHHKGLWFAYRKVNDEDFWLEPASAAHIKHIEVTKMAGGFGNGELSVVTDWLGKDGRVLLQEQRQMLFHTTEDGYAVDFDIALIAQNSMVKFGDHKDGMFAVQVADWLKEAGGSGRYFNSNGDQTAKNTWGKRARWVCLQGKKDNKVIGIAIFNHPSSVNFPTYWHTRDYGLFTANPLGQFVFENKRNHPNPQQFELTLQPGQAAHFRFRIIIYENAKTAEQLEQYFKEFAQ